MLDFLYSLSCLGWVMGVIAVLAILADRDARRERERQKAAKEEDSAA